MKYCEQCGAKLSETAKFCAECGFKLNRQETVKTETSVPKSKPPEKTPPANSTENPTQSLAKIVCGKCGEKNDRQAKVCSNCNTPLHETGLNSICPMCKSVMKNEYAICPVCQYNIEAKAWSSKDAFDKWQQSNSAQTTKNKGTPQQTDSTNKPIKFCGKCGTQIIENDKFCRKCGTKTDLFKNNISQNTTTPNPTSIANTQSSNTSYKNKKQNITVKGGRYSGRKWFTKIAYKTYETDVEFLDDKVRLSQGSGFVNTSTKIPVDIFYNSIYGVDTKNKFSIPNTVIAIIIALLAIVMQVWLAFLPAVVLLFIGKTATVTINHSGGTYIIPTEFMSEAEELRNKINLAISQSRA